MSPFRSASTVVEPWRIVFHVFIQVLESEIHDSVTMQRIILTPVVRWMFVVLCVLFVDVTESSCLNNVNHFFGRSCNVGSCTYVYRVCIEQIIMNFLCIKSRKCRIRDLIVNYSAIIIVKMYCENNVILKAMRSSIVL